MWSVGGGAFGEGFSSWDLCPPWRKTAVIKKKLRGGSLHHVCPSIFREDSTLPFRKMQRSRDNSWQRQDTSQMSVDFDLHNYEPNNSILYNSLSVRYSVREARGVQTLDTVKRHCYLQICWAIFTASLGHIMTCSPKAGHNCPKTKTFQW